MRKVLIEKRNNKGFTQKVMAEKLGISLSFYVKIEQQRRNPSLELAQNIAETLDASVEEIFFERKCHARCHKSAKKPTGTG